MSRKKKAAGAPKSNGRTPDKSAQLQELLNSFNPEDLAAFIEASGGAAWGHEDAAELFDDFISACVEGDMDDAEREDFSQSAIDALIDLRIQANGGDRAARGQLEEIHELVEGAVEIEELAIDDLMLLGRVLIEAELEAPDSLKQAVVARLQDQPAVGDVTALGAGLAELVEKSGLDLFGAHEQLRKTFALFPSEDAVRCLTEIASIGHPIMDSAFAGFALHPDAALAQAALSNLAARAQDKDRDRLLARMRPWLPPQRQEWLDAAMKTEPEIGGASTTNVKLHKCFASVCDAAGARTLVATKKEGAKFRAVCFMLSEQGVANVMISDPMSKHEFDLLLEDVSLAAHLSEVKFPLLLRILSLALAENLAAGTLPPFELAHAAETFDFPPLTPDASTPAQIIDRLLSEFPAADDRPDALATADALAAASDYTQAWFEAGPDIDDIFAKVKGKKRRAEAVLKSYLPGRRHFWARQCALTALSLHAENPMHPVWRALAVIGRDLAAGAPFDKIPLMRFIAEHTVEYYAAP